MLILTTGLSGSSLLTGLVAQAGYWIGDRTEYKNNTSGVYETYENSEFVSLNNKLVQANNLKLDEKFWYQKQYFDHFSNEITACNDLEIEDFLAKLTLNSPWLLKDPKVWVTLLFWLDKFNTEQLQVIVLSRDVKKLWQSQINKRIIYDYGYLKSAESESKQWLVQALNEKRIDYIEIEYDDLLSNTQVNLINLSSFLNIKLDMNHWQLVYNPKIKQGLKWLDSLKTQLIYWKNFPERIK